MGEPFLPFSNQEAKLQDNGTVEPMAAQITDSSVVSRAYQIEMFQASLHGNTIVVVC
jgi:hypothetical protein